MFIGTLLLSLRLFIPGAGIVPKMESPLLIIISLLEVAFDDKQASAI